MVERYRPFPWQKTLYDPIDADGCVQVPERPGLGDDIDFDYVREHTIDEGAAGGGAPDVY